MNTVTLKSGNTLEVQEAEFVHSWALTQAVAATLAASLPGIKLDNLDIEALQKDIDIGKVLSIVCQLVASKEVYELLWPCFTPCLYNQGKVTRITFNPGEARADFLPSVVEILKVNVVPFIKGLDLSSLSKQAQPADNQKSATK